MPVGSFTDLSSLSSLDLQNNVITEIEPGAFGGNMGEYFELYLGRNRITKLLAGIWSGVSLGLVNLRDNNIGEVEAGVWNGVDDLFEVSMSGNPSTCYVVPDEDNDDYYGGDLITCICEGGLITAADQRSCTMPTTAATTTLSTTTSTRNSAEFTLIGCTSLLDSSGLVADCKDRGIEEIPGGIPIGTVMLVLDRNPLPTIGKAALSAIGESLETLMIRNSGLQSLEDGWSVGLFLLETVVLSNSNISTVSAGTFADLPALKTIKFDSNTITDVAVGAFFNLPLLRELDISNNRLSVLKSGMWDGVPRLYTIGLQNNIIAAVGPSLWDGLDQLYELRMSDNPSICTVKTYTNTTVSCECGGGTQAGVQEMSCDYPTPTTTSMPTIPYFPVVSSSKNVLMVRIF